MFGKLSLSEIPLHNSVLMGAVYGTSAVALVIIALITYFGKWGYLWREWLTSLDHKKIGVMYIVLAGAMLVRGFIDALLMRMQQVMSVGASQGFLAPDHYAQIFSSHGTIMIIFVADAVYDRPDEHCRAAANRCARRCVSLHVFCQFLCSPPRGPAW